MTTTTQRDEPAFALKNADYNLKAYTTWAEAPADAMVTIVSPDNDQIISMNKMVWDMLVAAVAKQF